VVCATAKAMAARGCKASAKRGGEGENSKHGFGKFN